jgi:general secretion pathway protein G
MSLFRMMFRLSRQLSLGRSRFVPIGRTTLAAAHSPNTFELPAEKENDNDASRVFSIFASGRAGFTIIELMVAIAVMAALAAIAVPSYRDYRYKALVAQAKSDIKDLDVLITRYYSDNMSFPDSLADIGKAGMLDPWKKPYRYLRLSPLDPSKTGQVRKDKNLVPINADFDLYSMGKDGASSPPLTAQASRDDIVRGSNGRFVGLASEY